MVEHRKNFRTEKKDFYDSGQVKLSSVLYFFQEAATEHAEIIGVGGDVLMKDNIVWILAKMKLRILSDIIPDSDYYVRTYPRAQKSRFCPRDYYMYDAQDQLVAVGSAIWSLMDWTTRKIVKVDLDFGGDLREDEAFPEGFEKIRVKEPVEAGEYLVVPQDIDDNEHTNNCVYGDIAMRASTITEVGDFVIQYSKETREGEKIFLYREEAEDGEFICGKLEDEQTVFLAKLTKR